MLILEVLSPKRHGFVNCPSWAHLSERVYPCHPSGSIKRITSPKKLVHRRKGQPFLRGGAIEDFQENRDHVLDLFTREEDFAIFEKVYGRDHLTLKGNADWALGIVTGNNAKFLADHRDARHQPILTGKDLRRFTADVPKKFIHFKPRPFSRLLRYTNTGHRKSSCTSSSPMN